MKLSWKKYTLRFKQPAGTSRGVLRTKDSYFLVAEYKDKIALGECGLLRGLSADDRPDYESTLNWLCKNPDRPFSELYGELTEFPSIQFGLEMLLKDLKSTNHELFPSDFTQGNSGQPINGLIWMGDYDFMLKQVSERLEKGFRVLKMKVGAIELEKEMAILKHIRDHFNTKELELRVDANGAFKPGEALGILNRLAEFEIHSIEQPIAKDNWEEMARLCEQTPVPIALDEELIGLFEKAKREQMLRTIKPQYIILKPSFIGGFKGSEEWIALASDYNAGWWVTSALESNFGLSAIAQWNFSLKNPMPSGLGTGSLYTNNIPSPLHIKAGELRYDKSQGWDLDALNIKSTIN